MEQDLRAPLTLDEPSGCGARWSGLGICRWGQRCRPIPQWVGGAGHQRGAERRSHLDVSYDKQRYSRTYSLYSLLSHHVPVPLFFLALRLFFSDPCFTFGPELTRPRGDFVLRCLRCGKGRS